MSGPNKRGKSMKSSPSDQQQKFRTFANKQRQRTRHELKYPNDTESLARAKRWVK